MSPNDGAPEPHIPARAPVRNPRADDFIFCTGIENSYPVITNHNGRSMRRDGMQLSEHYTHWRHDLRLVAELGIRCLRYGPPYYRCHAGPGRYKWDFADKTFAELGRLGIRPITDLCHFGLPDWLGASFQNPDWPPLFAEYARAFAQRFPWVRLYTPVNEIFICAQFSARNGWWNERLASEQAFVNALKHMCKASVLAMEAILQVRRDAQFVQSESSTYFHPAIPDAREKAAFYNVWRFAALDLCYGHDLDAAMYEYLMDNGLSREEYHWFMQHGRRLRRHCVVGSDYYSTNEKKVVDADGAIELSGEVLGYYEIAKQYFDRYRLPIFHTETNRKEAADAPRWLRKEWFNIVRLKADGVPILGFTWYSLLDQTDWDVVLREDNERINPMGLYDLQRRIRPVGAAYRDLIAAWEGQLPLDSLTRDMSAPDARCGGEAARGPPGRPPTGGMPKMAAPRTRAPPNRPDPCRNTRPSRGAGKRPRRRERAARSRGLTPDVGHGRVPLHDASIRPTSAPQQQPGCACTKQSEPAGLGGGGEDDLQVAPARVGDAQQGELAR